MCIKVFTNLVITCEPSMLKETKPSDENKKTKKQKNIETSHLVLSISAHL